MGKETPSGTLFPKWGSSWKNGRKTHDYAIMKDGRFHASSAVVNPMYLGMHASDVAVFDGLAGPELLHAHFIALFHEHSLLLSTHTHTHTYTHTDTDTDRDTDTDTDTHTHRHTHTDTHRGCTHRDTQRLYTQRHTQSHTETVL